MSVRIKLSLLSEQHKKLIRKILLLQAKKTNYALGKNKFYMVPNNEPILFYWIDKPRDEIILPYIFANSLLGYHINSQLTFPQGNFNFTGQLRNEQISPINLALQQLDQFGTTTLSFPTGFGKSICATHLSSYCLQKTGGLVLVISPRETIQKGWYETFTRETNAIVWVVENQPKIPERCNVILCLNTRFEKIPKEIIGIISTLILDEAHTLTTACQVPVLLGTQPKYIIICTATLERDDNLHTMIQLIAGTHKVEVKNEKPFIVYKLNTGIKTELILNKNGTTDFSQLSKNLSMDPIRNAFIIDLVEKNPNSKIMILSWNKTHVNLLMNILKNREHSVDYLAGTKSSYKDSRILIGTISKVGTGFDAKNVAIDWDGLHIDTVILAGSTKSLSLHTQLIGRGFRANNPVIIDLVDDNPICKRHWAIRKKNYESLNCIIKEFYMQKNSSEEGERGRERTEEADMQSRNNILLDKLRNKEKIKKNKGK